MKSPKVIIVGGVILLSIIVSILFILLSTTRNGGSTKESPIPTIVPINESQETPKYGRNNQNNPNFTLIPTEASILPVGKPLQVTISFTTTVKTADLSVRLLQQSEQHDTENKDFAFSQRNETQSIMITSNASTDPFTKYTLELRNTSSGELLMQAFYFTGERIEQVTAQNNQALIQFLPYETPSYKLSFNKTRNMYVFNFKIDPNNRSGLDDQFQKAKSEAESFIKSKNIELNSLVIEWRRS